MMLEKRSLSLPLSTCSNAIGDKSRSAPKLAYQARELSSA